TEYFRATVERSDSGRPTHFVPGEGKKIATDLLHIHRFVSRALRSIDHRDCSDVARFATKFRDRIDCAKRVGNVRKRKKFYLRREEGREPLEIERSVIAHGHETKPCPDPFG